MTRLFLSLWCAIFAFCPLMQAGLPSGDGWKLHCHDFDAAYTGAPVANGTIGILPWKEPFSVKHLILNHIFEYSEKKGVNRVIAGINPMGMTMMVDDQQVTSSNIAKWNQEIDMRHARHNSQFLACGKVDVRYTIVALRNMPYAAMMRITVKARQDASVALTNTMNIPSDDYRDGSKCTAYKLRIENGFKPALKACAETSHGRYKAVAEALFVPEKGVWAVLPPTGGTAQTATIQLQKGEEATISLATSVCTTRDFTDPWSEVEREVIYILKQKPTEVLAAHDRCWDKLWCGNITIEGDDEAQRVVRFALYNLYSFCRRGTGLSISPMGLSSKGYNGHIFWDSETWMMPPMLVMNPDIARCMIDYRTDRLDAARQRAATIGYDGAMYPWESDDMGQESTPSWALTGPLEHHISADIAIAAWNYYRMSGDDKWLREKGYPMMKAIAEFWVSRVTENADGSYSIKNVVGADEYATGVDDNAFTNGATIVALRSTVKAAIAVGEEAPVLWSKIADRLRIPKMNNGVTADYEGYQGQMIKQTDANLLAYPLGLISDEKQIRADMLYYEDKLDKKNGPAMAHSIFATLYARIGDRDRATEAFRMSYRPNMRPPFGVFAETATSSNPYFATGAGGMLQAVIYGFAGLDITDQGIAQVHKPLLPNGWKSLVITTPGGATYKVEK